MKSSSKFLYWLISSVLALIVCVVMAGATPSFADEQKECLTGQLYQLDEGSNYEFSATSTSLSTNSDFGEFSISGDIQSIDKVDGITAYNISNGNVSIHYSLGNKYLGEDTSTWYLIEDSTDEIDGEEIEADVKKGAILVQSSFDGKKWITDKVLTNVAADSEYSDLIYTTKNIQQINGCYYRVVVAYKLEKVVGSSSFLFLDFDDKENMKCAEVYTFYLIDSSDNNSEQVLPADTPKKQLGEVVNAGNNVGYSETNDITKDDPHYGWTIGSFFINGFTRETVDVNSNTPVFLKNVGDRVTLWFNLAQDIECLNGNEDLAIYEDNGGYDQYYQIERTNMGHGTLIIRYTDYEGVKHDPVIYTDFLRANTHTGADTKVELFEEGDYEVALDYKVVNSSGIDSYNDYRIFFKFAIRNGNCMVFPFDIVTGNELRADSITANGFKLDMAKSRYLTIDVTKSVLIDNGAGKTEDVRFNRPAKDGEQYTEEGIYRFNVHNLYTGESTTKTIYVGADSFITAMSVNELSVEELNNILAEGCTIEAVSGKLLFPDEYSGSTSIELDTVDWTADELPVSVGDEIEDKESEPHSQGTATNASLLKEDEVEDTFEWWVLILIFVGIGGAAIVGYIIYKQKMKVNKDEQQKED